MGFTRNDEEQQYQCPTCRRYYPQGATCGWCPEHPQVEDPAVIEQRDAEEARREAEAIQRGKDLDASPQALESPDTSDASATPAPHADEPADVAQPATPAPAVSPPPPAGRARRER